MLSPKVEENIASFVKDVVAKYAEEIDRRNRAPLEFFREAAVRGILGLTIPRSYGGSGLGLPEFVEVLERISMESPSAAHMLFVHSMSASFIEMFGSPELKEELLPTIAEGRRILALSFTEPKSGTDLASIETKAERMGDTYVLNGEKLFTTNALYADTFIVLARTGPLEAGHRALTLFAVDRVEGVKIGEPLDLVGFRGTGLAPVKLENVEVPASRLIGKENEGFRPSVLGLGVGRIPFSAISLGIAKGALYEAIRWALTRKSFGKPIYENQAVSFPLAQLAAEIEAVGTLILRAAEMFERGENPMLYSSMVKLLAAQLAVKAARTAVQIMGGWGLLSESKVSRLYRDAKATEIAEGTNEVQLMIIARELARRAAKKT